MKAQQIKPIVDRMVMEELKRQKMNIEKLCIAVITATFLITLHDKYDFDKAKLNEIVAYVTNQFMAIRDKFVTLGDFEKWCKEMGIDGL